MQRTGKPCKLFRTIAAFAAILAAASGASASGVSIGSDVSVCRNLAAATVRIISGTDRTSGVVVTLQGHILTVAHGLHGDSNRVIVVFSDGTTAAGGVLLKDVNIDVAVVKVDDADSKSLSVIRIPPELGLKKNSVVLAAGYPGRERNGLSAVFRMGAILAVEPQVIRSSCTLTAGDSGGPLINQLGELIGLHRQIGIGTESNLHLPLEYLRRAVLPVLDLTSINREAGPDPQVHLLPETLISSGLVESSCRARTVEIRHFPMDARPLILGTLLSDSLVATKLSELMPGLPLQCRFQGDASCFASIVRSSTVLDIAILKLEVVQPNVAALPLPGDLRDRESQSGPGQLVFAASNSGGVSRAGIVSREHHTEPSLDCRLGAVLNTANQAMAVVVTDVAPNSTAASANLAAGDVIRALNGSAVATLEDVDRILNQYQPGDWLTIEFLREPERHSETVRLQHNPSEQFERSEFLDGRSGRVSGRRSGFTDVLQHDVPISPNECGGPLCDTAGQIVAINIARRARESTLAVPIRDILKLATEAAAAAEEGPRR